MVALLRRGWVDFHLTDCKTDGRDEHREAETADRIGELRHGLLMKSLRERRGAAVRSCGNAWNIEAITGTYSEGGRSNATRHVIDFGFSVVRYAGAVAKAEPCIIGPDRRKRRPTVKLHHQTPSERRSPFASSCAWRRTAT
jgi:hypothetical protein